ncbi:ATP-binding protein [Risungbinella massiliensis]|uniref:ATP-binding protein n=1 Tax=Risungbinella massiliensis TaxID=1329796 RepID=UPI0005CC8E3B|nr:ATP-binding protein [Risungbinella massiliensis]
MNHEAEIQPILEALKLSPENKPLKQYAASLLQKAGRLEEAKKYLEELLQEDPTDLDNKGKLAEVYYQMTQFDKAKELLQGEGSSLSATQHVLLSKSHYHLGEYTEAVRYYEKAQELDRLLIDEEYQRELAPFMVEEKPKLKVLDFRKKEDTEDDDLLERPTITFESIGGLEELKENIRMQILYPLQNPDLFRSYGKQVGGGLLLYGPPGCGKTHIARATAGECNANFISINIHDILDMYIGQSERNLHSIFETARRNSPTIIFIDELDALGGSRQKATSSHSRSLTNQLLSELDGVHSQNKNILVLGATNTPWFVDSALRRPGRFDRVLFVSPPDLEARVEILQICLKDKPTESIDYVKVAKKMEKFSGADIRGVCNAATDLVLQEVMKSGKKVLIQTKHLLDALKKIKPSTTEWLSTAKNYATYSNESGVYDEILQYLKK